jgi:hypothetical protein
MPLGPVGCRVLIHPCQTGNPTLLGLSC